jgi:nucleoid-associated protein YgaU
VALMVALVVTIIIYDNAVKNKEKTKEGGTEVAATSTDDPFAALSGTTETPAPQPPDTTATQPPPLTIQPTPPAGETKTTPPPVIDGPRTPPEPAPATESPKPFVNPFEEKTPPATETSTTPATETSATASPFSPFTPQPPSSTSGRTHTVRRNESFWTIAVKYYNDGTKWKLIKSANQDRVKGEFLPEGTELVIPDAGDTPSSAASVRTAKGPLAADEYRVQEGDSLWSIAKERLGNAIHWEKIYEANRDVMKDKNTLKKGMVLRIPDKASLDSGSAAPRKPDLKGAIPTEFAGKRTYRIQQGDNLWDIAEKELGNGIHWEKILDANRGRIDPNNLKVGKLIVLPEVGAGSSR